MHRRKYLQFDGIILNMYNIYCLSFSVLLTVYTFTKGVALAPSQSVSTASASWIALVEVTAINCQRRDNYVNEFIDIFIVKYYILNHKTKFLFIIIYISFK